MSVAPLPRDPRISGVRVLVKPGQALCYWPRRAALQEPQTVHNRHMRSTESHPTGSWAKASGLTPLLATTVS